MARLSHLLAAAAALVLLAGAAKAADPAFDCAKADGAAEEAICQSDGLASLDVELSRLYKLAVASVSDDKARLDELKAYQRGWVKGRNDCWKADDLDACIVDSYAMRIHELRQGYAGARAGEDTPSLGPFAYQCEGLDAFVSAVFINTEESLVSLAWADNWIVLPQAVSGSGARYAIEGGQGAAEFWTKGDSAMFTPPGMTETLDCKEEEIG
ncbi:MliC family protein [Acuticoccus kandeliae]|uniref:MliC family protein n=1 Tax=Acuticoccus kandeliae TaxID=2073160 RepID=UPI000D3E428C|nr:MliC family protein [Acuticoccus kandeliae]